MHWLSGTGHVLWANETEMNVLGYTPEEYIGQPIMKCMLFDLKQYRVCDTICKVLTLLLCNSLSG